jgi:CheY-like chemotaxis protein
MSDSTQTKPALLVASEDTHDVAMVEKLLGDEFGQVLISANPDNASQEFDRLQPDVLVLAFNDVEKSERYYLGLFRQSAEIHRQPHRTIILCNKDEVRQAYTRCRDGLFDDYVLFWPVTHDAPRLLMAVHHALRELAAINARGPTLTDFAVQARHLADLEPFLDRMLSKGRRHIEEASRAIEDAEHEIDTTLEGISRRVTESAGSMKNAGELEREIGRIRRGELHQRFRIAAKSVQPLKQWTEDFQQEVVPHVESARVIRTISDHILPTILVVDDDEFQHKLIGKILDTEKYQLIFAASAIDAMRMLSKILPDLILLDVQMPDMDGIEANRRLKAVPRFANIPVIMITGMGEKQIVEDAIKMGVTDFIVKPFDREILAAKVADALDAKK